jgi:tetratricopeptide (TPR) repeat protein
MKQAVDTSRAQELLAKAWDNAFADPEGCRDWASQALEVSAGTEEAATAFWLLALTDWQLDKLDPVSTHLRLARQLFVQLESARGQALCAELDAALALRQGDAIRASLIHRALDSAMDPGTKPLDRFLARWQRGVFARLLGQHDKALDHYRAATESAEASRNPGALAIAHAYLGGLLLEHGRIEPALAHAEAAWSLAKHSGAGAWSLTTAAQLIVIRHAQNRPSDVLDLAQYISEQGSAHARGALAKLAVPLALAYWVAGDVDRAEAWLENGSGTQAMQGDNGIFWAWVSTRCLLARQEVGLARDLAERTVSARQAKALPYHLAQLLQAAADACTAAGDAASAQRHREAAAALFPDLANPSAAARQATGSAARVFTAA